MRRDVIGENIRKLRENTGFSHANIAGFLHVDQDLILRVETGESALSSDMLDKIAALFGTTITALISPNVETSQCACAFRENEFSVEDMETICAINRIALNSEFMNTLLDRKKL